ncbi:MAG: TonB-dependent receptor [Pseudomonadales bacterium]|jgi:outer membrane receptor protein involved in Fe transport
MTMRKLRSLIAVLLVAPAFAVAQSGDIEEIVVTGSHIKGSPEDAASPVQTLQREDIVASGVSDVSEVVRNLSVASGSDTAPQDGARFNGAAGSGLANVNLRGLGPTSTLVLLDGKRLPYAGQKLSDGDRFVDINSIPITMIQRVEVLKNGASAIYGSDAIAGVVNFITRSDFEGFEVTGKYQDVTKGSQTDATIGAIFGWGSADDRAHFVIGGEWFDRTSEASSDRPDLRADLYEKQDATIVNRFSVWPSGPDANCLNTGADFFVDNFDGSDPNSCNRHALNTPAAIMIPAQSRGSVMFDGRFSFSDSAELYGQASYMKGDSGESLPVYGGPIEPKYFLPTLIGAFSGVTIPPDGWPNDPSMNVNGGNLPTPAQLAFYPPGTLPLTLADYTLRTPGIENDRKYHSGNDNEYWRVSGGLRGDFNLGEKSWSYDFGVTYGENTFSTKTLEINKDRLELAMYGLGGPDCTPNGSLDPADPRAALARYYLAGTDGQFDDTATDPGAVGPLESFFLALSGPLPGFPYINPDNLVMAMTSSNMGDESQGCNFFNPYLSRDLSGSPNSEELLQWIEYPMKDYQKTDTYLTEVDMVLSGELFEFNGNMISLAFGGQYREEGRKTAVNPQITGTVNSFGYLSGGTSLGGLSENRNFDADRNVWALFAELALPLTDDIDVQLAGRWEDYGGDIGSHFDPKLAVRWQTTNSLVLRGAVSTSFRGPALAQINEGTGYSLEFGVADYLGQQGGSPPEGSNCVRTGRCAIPAEDAAPTIIIVKQGLETPDLSPETATSWNAGFIWTPTGNFLEGLTVNLDYYQINFEDKIIDVPTQAFLTEELGRFQTALAAGDFTIVDPTQASFGQPCDPSDSIYDPGAANPLAEICQVNPAAYAVTASDSEFNGNVLRRPDVTRSLQIISSRAINTGKVDTSGIDAYFQYLWDSSFGQWSVDSRMSYIIDYKVKDFPTGQPDYDAAGWANRGPNRRITRSMPDFKGNAQLSWFYKNHFARFGMRFVGSYKDDSVPSLRLEEKFDPYFAFDLTYSYTFRLGDSGDLQFTVGAIDLFQADLPNVKDSRGVDLYTFDQRGRRLYAAVKYSM